MNVRCPELIRPLSPEERVAEGLRSGRVVRAKLALKRTGEVNPNWKGDAVTKETGRDRAARMYPKSYIGPCVRCGNPKSERHHVDGNTKNNAQGNIMILCRRCHMIEDGRLLALAAMPKRVAKPKPPKPPRLPRKTPITCRYGHPFIPENRWRTHCRLCWKWKQEAKKRTRVHP